MARSARGCSLPPCPRRSARNPLSPSHRSIQKVSKRRSPCKAISNDWEDATCAVCMEYPHNAVLLLCSSHHKGCRPYMCGTSYRLSNCLDQFTKAYTKSENAEINQISSNFLVKNRSEMAELACPLCRGQVKGWTVVDAAREYLNKKKRCCMQDGCSFTGSYKKLYKHVKTVHPAAKPHKVDPVHEEKWKILQEERDREDVMSTIRSSMPGALVMGDYVIENVGFDGDDVLFDRDDDGSERDGVGRNWMQFFWFLRRLGNASSASHPRPQGRHRVLEEDDGEHNACNVAGEPVEENDDDRVRRHLSRNRHWRSRSRRFAWRGARAFRHL